VGDRPFMKSRLISIMVGEIVILRSVTMIVIGTVAGLRFKWYIMHKPFLYHSGKIPMHHIHNKRIFYLLKSANYTYHP
jgi:hypothetical protein